MRPFAFCGRTQPTAGLGVTLADATIAAAGVAPATGSFSQTVGAATISATGTAQPWLEKRRRGVNLVSMNMDLSWLGGTGPVRGGDYPQYADALLDWMQSSNVGAVRFMFTWEALQSSFGGTVPPSSGTGYAHYWSDFTDTIARLLSRGIYVSICPWQYNPSSLDTDITYEGAAFTAANFGDFWGKLATAINTFTGNDQRVAFDLINEPHTHAQSGNRAGDIGITLANWILAAQAAINAIRGAGAANTIFVSGMSYGAAESFITNGSSVAWLTLTDSGNNLAATAHNYTQVHNHSTSATIHRDSINDMVTWARSNGIKVQVGEIAQDDAAHSVSQAQAIASWSNWEAYQIANNDVLIGWTWWGVSQTGWWSSSDTHWGPTLDNGATTTKFYDDLLGSTWGTT